MKVALVLITAVPLLTSSVPVEAFLPAASVRQGRKYAPLTIVGDVNGDRRSEWSPSSWRDLVSQTKQETQEGLERAAKRIGRYAPLVFAGEIRTLQENLARACHGQGFLLMGDDSAEAFDEFNVDHIRDTFRVILQMALVLTYGSAVPVIKIGRMSYRRDVDSGKDGADDIDEYDDIIEGYHQAVQTINILRAFSSGGYADINRLHSWNLDFVEQTDEGSRYRIFAEKVDSSLLFMRAVGVDTSGKTFSQVEFFTAHECLRLPYEQALTRQDSTTGKWYDCSAHMLWLKKPEATRLEFIRGIGNPLGVKIDDECTPDVLMDIIDAMNPQNIPGKLTIVVRMEAEKLREKLPALIRAVQREGKSVLWISDPTHNMRTTETGYKTRDFEAIRSELRAFFDVHEEMGSHPGGVHLEMTGKDVTECVGGECDVTEEQLKDSYQSSADPRLNGEQAIELAFLIAERMRKRAGLPPIA